MFWQQASQADLAAALQGPVAAGRQQLQPAGPGWRGAAESAAHPPSFVHPLASLRHSQDVQPLKIYSRRAAAEAGAPATKNMPAG